MQRVAELERNMRHLKDDRDIRLQEEQNELTVRMEEMDIEIRSLKNERDKQLLAVYERYQNWLDTTKKIVCNEKV